MSYVFFGCPLLFLCLYSVPMLAHHFMLSRVRTKMQMIWKGTALTLPVYSGATHTKCLTACVNAVHDRNYHFCDFLCCICLGRRSLMSTSKTCSFDCWNQLQPCCDNTCFCVPLTLSMFCLSVLVGLSLTVCFSTATEINLMFILYCQSWIYLFVTTLFQSHQYHGEKQQQQQPIIQNGVGHGSSSVVLQMSVWMDSHKTWCRHLCPFGMNCNY